jgi:hypothetical protein
MIEAVTPLVLIGGGVLMAIFTMMVGTYIGNTAATLEKEAAQRRYEHSDKLMGLGNGIAAGLIGAGTAILRFRGDRREDEPFRQAVQPPPPTVNMRPSPEGDYEPEPVGPEFSPPRQVGFIQGPRSPGEQDYDSRLRSVRVTKLALDAEQALSGLPTPKD